jgi:SAM-dependent methyltransferase
MYGRFAEIYDAIYAFKDYKTESEAIKKLIRAKCPSAHTLLDVGCGTGAHLAFLAQDFDCVGLDFSEQQLERARTKLPNVTFVQGDMRNFDLGRKFDAVVCLFGTVGYSQDLEGLQQSMDHLAAHLSPGGVLLLEPWLTKDKFQSGRFDMITADAADMKIARSNTTRRDGDTSILDFHFLVVSAAGSEHFEESHRLGLFSDEDYRRCIDRAGLSAEHDEKGLMGRGLYTAWLRQ